MNNQVRKNEKMIADFNSKYSAGDKVKLLKDDDSVEVVTVSSKATLLGGHTAVGWFEEISGCYLLERVIN